MCTMDNCPKIIIIKETIVAMFEWTIVVVEEFFGEKLVIFFMEIRSDFSLYCGRRNLSIVFQQ